MWRRVSGRNAPAAARRCSGIAPAVATGDSISTAAARRSGRGSLRQCPQDSRRTARCGCVVKSAIGALSEACGEVPSLPGGVLVGPGEVSKTPGQKTYTNDPNTEECTPKQLTLAPVAENCSNTVVGDVGVGQAPVGPGVLYGATQRECCVNCSALSTCRTWVYATEHHKAGTCWLLASAGTLLRKSDRISGGDLKPHAP